MQRYFLLKLAGLFSLLSLVTACASGPFSFSTASNFAHIDTVYIAPIAVSEDLQTRSTHRMRRGFQQKRPVSQSDLTKKAQDLAKSLTREISQSHSVSSGSDHNTLTIRITITDLIASRPTKADYDAEPGLSFQSIYAGGLSAKVCFELQLNNAECFDFDYKGNLQEVRGGSIWYDADYGIRRLSRKIANTINRS